MREQAIQVKPGADGSVVADDPAERDASILAYRQVVVDLAAEDAKCRVE